MLALPDMENSLAWLRAICLHLALAPNPSMRASTLSTKAWVGTDPCVPSAHVTPLYGFVIGGTTFLSLQTWVDIFFPTCGGDIDTRIHTKYI